MQLVNLAFKGAGHHPLAQTFDAVHLGFHQASAVVANPAFPDTAAQTPTRSKRSLRCSNTVPLRTRAFLRGGMMGIGRA